MKKVKKYLPGAESLGTSFGDKAGAAMGNYGGAITQAAGSLMPLLMKKPDPNAKPYKKGTKLLKYGEGSKGLFDSGSNFREGLDYGLTGASFIPGLGYAANLAGSGLDLYDAYNAKTPEDRNMALASAGMGLIPGGRIARAALRATKVTKTLAKVAPKVANSVDPSYVNKLVNNKTIKEFRNSEQISNAARKAAESAKGTFGSLWDKTKGVFSGQGFKEGTKNINLNNMKIGKYDGGTKSTKPSRYQRLDAKLGGFLPGGVTRAQVKASKTATPSGSVGPMAGGYKTPPQASTGVGPLYGGYVIPAPDLSKPVGPMTDIGRYTKADSIPSGTLKAKPKVNFKKPAAAAGKKPLGGGYKMYEDMNTDQKRQYRAGMESGKDFTVDVADKYGKTKTLKYAAASKDAKALSSKRNAEYDERYQKDLMGKYPATKDLKKHDHLEYWLDKTIDNAKTGKKSGATPTPNPTPKKEDDDDNGFGFLGGLLGAGGAAGLYYGAKKLLKKNKYGKVVEAVLPDNPKQTAKSLIKYVAPAVEEGTTLIKKKTKMITEGANTLKERAQKIAQDKFDELNKVEKKALPSKKQLLLN